MPRPSSLRGLRIGFLDNTKAPVDRMMERLAHHLQSRIPDCTPYFIAKQHPLAPMEPEVLRALRDNADVVIDALGD